MTATDVVAILVGAGRGERMAAGRPKAFILLAGQSLLRRSAAAFDAAPMVARLIAVVPAEMIEKARAELAGLGKPVTVIGGGARRQDSVRAALATLEPGFDGVVLVHDAARPLVPQAVIRDVAAAAATHGAALPVIPIADTVKRVRDGVVAETVDRSELYGAQTPQGFRFSVLQRAYAGCDRDGQSLTDEAMAVERLGEPVACVPGSHWSRKMTTPEDLRWAEWALAADGSP